MSHYFFIFFSFDSLYMLNQDKHDDYLRAEFLTEVKNALLEQIGFFDPKAWTSPSQPSVLQRPLTAALR